LGKVEQVGRDASVRLVALISGVLLGSMDPTQAVTAAAGNLQARLPKITGTWVDESGG